MENMMPDATTELLTLTADIVSAHVANNSVAFPDVPGLIRGVYAALSGLGNVSVPKVAKQEPAVSVRASVKPEYLVCLEDGKKLKMLKRHLMTSYGLTPDDYRAKWSLPNDYPMVAPNYAAQRRSLALKNGLGTKRNTAQPKASSVSVPVEASAKPKGGRLSKDAEEPTTAVVAARPKPARRRKLGIAAAESVGAEPDA